MAGLKYDEGKPEFDRLSFQALGVMNEVHRYGDSKYERGNWKQGLDAYRLLNAALRHIFKMIDGEFLDPESGLLHIAHAAVNCEMLIHYIKNPERYKEFFKGFKEGYHESDK